MNNLSLFGADLERSVASPPIAPARAISLWQPWASLIAWGEKLIETRSWATTYRGRIAIHAAKRVELDLLDNEHFIRAMRDNGFPNYVTANQKQRTAILKALPTGCIVAVADLVDCVQFRTWETTGDLNIARIHHCRHIRFERLRVCARERAFGNYEKERWGWMLQNIRPLSNPVPCQGFQQLWMPDVDVIAEVVKVLEGGNP